MVITINVMFSCLHLAIDLVDDPETSMIFNNTPSGMIVIMILAPPRSERSIDYSPKKLSRQNTPVNLNIAMSSSNFKPKKVCSIILIIDC